MNFIFKIEDNKAELIKQAPRVDQVITQDTYPAMEFHENTHAELVWTEEEGIHWIYIPYTPAEKREKAYRTEKIVEWDGRLLTIDEANDMWVKYDAEGNTKAAALTILIAEAKAEIRERYPDEDELGDAESGDGAENESSEPQESDDKNNDTSENTEEA